LIEQVVQRWHQHLRGELPGGLDALLHPDVVFISPVVFTPQRGRDITKLYLAAASQVLPGDATAPSAESSTGSAESGDGKFRYVKTILDGNHAVLEFETTVGDIVVNGIDMITCDDAGMITEFKVMVRPKKALEAVHAQMKAMLESMAGTDPR